MAKIIELVTNAGQVDVTQGIVEEAAKAVPEMAKPPSRLNSKPLKVLSLKTTYPKSRFIIG